MKYFFDTEFIENGVTIDLISIGVVDETGERTLYLQNAECDFSKANDWVWRNVFPNLIHFNMRGMRACSPTHETYDSGLGHRTLTKCCARNPEPKDPCFWAKRDEIREEVFLFCDMEKYGKPEFWGYYADYDWVVFCQLFGAMIALPNGFPMYCRDLKQLLDEKGNPHFQKDSIHHALNDAEWIRETYMALLK